VCIWPGTGSGIAEASDRPAALVKGMRRFDQLPPEGYDLAGHLARKYGKKLLLDTVDGFSVWSSLVSDRPYLVRSLDVVELASGERVGHVRVSATGRVKIVPGCSCRPSASEAIAAREAARPAGRR